MSVKAESEGYAGPGATQSLSRSPTVSRIGLIFSLIVVAYFLDVIDASIVTVAAPSIAREWAVSNADLQWVYSAYALTIAGFLLLMGRAGDVYGQKKIFLAGLIIFTVSSATGGLAPFFLSLVVSRAAQGIGAAMTTVTAFAIFIGIYPEGKERNRAFGVLIAILSGGFAAGAVLGGFLTVTFGWRSVMFVNAPIGALAVILCQKFLPNLKGWGQTTHLDVPRTLTVTSGNTLFVFRAYQRLKGWVQSSRLDIPGALTVTSGTMLFVFTLTNAASPGGLTSELTWVSLVASIALLGLFLVIESRSKSPLMPLSFIRRGSILTANTLAVLVTSIVGGISFIFTLYWQTILHYSAEIQGLAILPAAVIFFVVGGWGAAFIMGKIGVRKTLLVSTAIVTLGVLLLTSISVGGSYYAILPGLLIWATGASMGFPAVNIAAVAGTKHGEEGLASGIANTSFRIGFPLGTAILLAIAGAFDPVPTGGATSSPEGVVAGFRAALFAGALLGAFAFLIALRIKDSKPGGWDQSAQSVA